MPSGLPFLCAARVALSTSRACGSGSGCRRVCDVRQLPFLSRGPDANPRRRAVSAHAGRRSGAGRRPRCPQARPATSGGFPDTSETRTPACATRMSSRPLGLSLLQPEPDRGYFLRRRPPGTLPGRCPSAVPSRRMRAGRSPAHGLRVGLWSRQRPGAGRWACGKVQG